MWINRDINNVKKTIVYVLFVRNFALIPYKFSLGKLKLKFFLFASFSKTPYVKQMTSYDKEVVTKYLPTNLK